MTEASLTARAAPWRERGWGLDAPPRPPASTRPFYPVSARAAPARHASHHSRRPWGVVGREEGRRGGGAHSRGGGGGARRSRLGCQRDPPAGRGMGGGGRATFSPTDAAGGAADTWRVAAGPARRQTAAACLRRGPVPSGRGSRATPAASHCVGRSLPRTRGSVFFYSSKCGGGVSALRWEPVWGKARVCFNSMHGFVFTQPLSLVFFMYCMSVFLVAELTV